MEAASDVEDRSLWRELDEAAPELAAFGRKRLDGKVAYLATVRRDGRPRAHPVTPVIGRGHCFIFMDPASPKVRDLVDNGFYCLHCSMSDSSGSSGEFQMAGSARLVTDPDVRELAEGLSVFRPAERFLLFELGVAEAMSVAYRGGRPYKQRWPD
jgi:hypothetical protein